MNASFTMYRRSIIIRENIYEIYYDGLIQKMYEYDLVLISTLRYLNDEGWLETIDEQGNVKIIIPNEIHIIDGSGKQIFREKCIQ